MGLDSAAATASDDVLTAGVDVQADGLLFGTHRRSATQGKSEYTGDDYSRVGCTLVVNLSEKGWTLAVYAPGAEPVPATAPIESYFSRPYGSTGIALEAFLHRPGGIRATLQEMARAEREHQVASGSIVTS